MRKSTFLLPAAFLLFSVFLLAGCISSPPAEDTRNPFPTVSAAPYRNVFHMQPVQDMAELDGKLYILGGDSKGSSIYQYVDDKIAPKKVFELGYRNNSDPRFKGESLEMNSLAVYGGRLYAAGMPGLFALRQDGSWEDLNYQVPGQLTANRAEIGRIKVLGGELQAAIYYPVSVHESGSILYNGSIAKLAGTAWQVLPGNFDYPISTPISDLEVAGGKLYVAEDSYKVYQYVTEGTPSFKNLVGGSSTDGNYANLYQFIRLGSDGQELYACGKGSKIYRFAGSSWQLLHEVANRCAFFKSVDGVLYVGTNGYGKTSGQPTLPSEVGLFRIAGGKVEQVATVPINNSKPVLQSVTSIAKHGGELIVGSDWGDLYKVRDGKLEKMEFYKD